MKYDYTDQFSQPHLYILFEKGWKNVYFLDLGVEELSPIANLYPSSTTSTTNTRRPASAAGRVPLSHSVQSRIHVGPWQTTAG